MAAGQFGPIGHEDFAKLEADRDQAAARAVRKAVDDLNAAIRAAVRRDLTVDLDTLTTHAPGQRAGHPHVTISVRKDLV